MWTLRLFILPICFLFGCSGPSAEQQASALGSSEFTVAAWAGASQEVRGEMIKSFLREYDVKTLTATQIFELLGPSTAYFYYNADPAYLVGPRTVETVYGKGYLLVFAIDRATGRVMEVQFTPPVDTLY